MEWSVKIGRFIGIDVYMHLTFLLLIGWVALMRWQNGRSVSAVSVGVLFILVIFFCVTLHEFGYALMARRYGVPTRDIILLPIGRVARLEKIPIQPIQELWVALAGPAVNAVIAVALFIWLKLTASWEPLESLYVTTGPFLERLMAVNLFMIVFNMIAAFPMDGGRVLCAVLATRQEYGRATRIAASIGRGTALVFGVAGIFYNPLAVKGNAHGPEHDRYRQSRGSIVGPFPYSREPLLEEWTGCFGFSETLRLTVLPRAGGAVAPLQRCV